MSCSRHPRLPFVLPQKEHFFDIEKAFLSLRSDAFQEHLPTMAILIVFRPDDILHPAQFLIGQKLEMKFYLCCRVSAAALEAEPDETVDQTTGHVHDLLDRLLDLVVACRKVQLFHQFVLDGEHHLIIQRLGLGCQIHEAVPGTGPTYHSHPAPIVQVIFDQSRRRN